MAIFVPDKWMPSSATLSVSEVGIIFWGSSPILAILGQSSIASIVPLILDRGQRNLVGLAEIWANCKL